MLLSKAFQATVSYSIEQPHTGFACKRLTLEAEAVEIKHYKDKIWCDFHKKVPSGFLFKFKTSEDLDMFPAA